MPRPRPLGVVLIAASCVLPIAAQTPSPALSIVVIEGEDAINIVQQRTAVAPVIEVRDRNQQPVAGAVVQFAIRNGRATFNGARTLSVTTNAAGRAVATGLTPTGGGALQIGATATFQGHTAAATIAQTNVMTAAQAAAASSAGASGGTSTGATGGAAGGGGFPLTTVAVIGGAAAGGLVAANELAGGDSATLYSGPITLRATLSQRFGSNGVFTGSCTRDTEFSGTMEIRLREEGSRVAGELKVIFLRRFTASTCPGTLPDENLTVEGPVSGSGGNITFREETRTNNPFGDLGNGEASRLRTFNGTLRDGTITGTWTMAYEASVTQPTVPGALFVEGYGSTSVPVSLTRQ